MEYRCFGDEGMSETRELPKIAARCFRFGNLSSLVSTYFLAEELNDVKGCWRYGSVLVHQEIEAERHMMRLGVSCHVQNLLGGEPRLCNRSVRPPDAPLR